MSLRRKLHANIARVAATERILDRADRRGRETLATIGREIREARLGLGLSQSFVARAAGISASHLSRIELAQRPNVGLLMLVRLCAAVGLDLSSRVFPSGRPIRDRAHIELLDRFGRRLGSNIKWRAEVPIPIAGDQRAWDLVLSDGHGRAGVEAETHLRDLQALERRIALKKRDSGVDRVVLVVRDTRWNRQVLRSWAEVVAASFPGSSRRALDQLASGRLPESDVAITCRVAPAAIDSPAKDLTAISLARDQGVSRPEPQPS
jgi:transcriptional regulator with XRE-family HTH domain